MASTSSYSGHRLLGEELPWILVVVGSCHSVVKTLAPVESVSFVKVRLVFHFLPLLLRHSPEFYRCNRETKSVQWHLKKTAMIKFSEI